MIPSITGEVYLDNDEELLILSKAFRLTDVGFENRNEMPVEISEGVFDKESEQLVRLSVDQQRLGSSVLQIYEERFSDHTFDCALARSLRSQLDDHLGTLDS